MSGPCPRRYHFQRSQNRFGPRDRWTLSKRLKEYKSQNGHLRWKDIAMLINIPLNLLEALVHGGTATEVTCETVEKFLGGKDDLSS